MKYKIAFFTEGMYTGKISRAHPNSRVDLAWQIALDANHHNFKDSFDDIYDFGIILLPKVKPELVFKNINFIKSRCKYVALMQEGPNWYWEDYSLELQIEYLNLLRSVDLILCHNESDINYYKGISGKKEVYVMPSLIIEDGLPIMIPGVKRNGVMIGGNMCSWYGGMVSYLVASELDLPLYAPSMGRKIPREDELPITYLPYMNWKDWMGELHKRKFAVHLMKTKAAGSFALNCARLAIPCIGFMGLDTQEKCFPKLTVRDGDINRAIQIIKRLKDDANFRECVVAEAKENYREFDESNFIIHMQGIFSKIFKEV